MAYAYRLGGAAQANIRIARADLAGSRLGMALVLGKVAHPLTGAVLRGDTVHIADDVCQLERVIFRARNRQVFLLIRDLDGGQPDYVEHVLFHHSFFAPFFDYAKAAPWGDTGGIGAGGMGAGGFGPRQKPGLLAVFTHVRDDADMLRFWEAHYARLVEHRHLFVIDHGSVLSPREVLHPETNVVRLPRGETDHADMARFCGHYQRFLLSQYRWVLHSDADELLVDEAGEDALRWKLSEGMLRGIVAPARAIDLIHDVRPNVRADVPPDECRDVCRESSLRPGELLSRQRSVVLPATERYKKPMLADMPASWLQGFHQVYEEAALHEEPSLWLVHLHAADARLLRSKNRKWNALSQTEADRLICPQNRPEDAAELGRWYAEKLADERLAPLPEVLKGRF